MKKFLAVTTAIVAVTSLSACAGSNARIDTALVSKVEATKNDALLTEPTKVAMPLAAEEIAAKPGNTESKTIAKAISTSPLGQSVMAASLANNEAAFEQVAALLPKVGLVATGSVSDDLGKTHHRHGSATFGPEVTWELSSATGHKIAREQLNQGSTFHKVEGTFLQIAMGAVQYGNDIRVGYTHEKIDADDIEVRKDLIAKAKKAVAAKLRPESDERVAEASLARVEGSKETYRKSLEQAEARWFRVTGERFDRAMTDDIRANMAELGDLKKAAENHPTVRELDLKIEALRREILAIAAEANPSLKLKLAPIVQAVTTGNYFSLGQMLIEGTMPVFDDTIGARVNKAAYNLVSMAKQREDQLRVTQNAIEEAFVAYRQDTLAATKADVEAKKLARAYELKAKEYEAGLASIQDLITALDQASAAKHKAAEAKKTAAYAPVHVKVATGELLWTYGLVGAQEVRLSSNSNPYRDLDSMKIDTVLKKAEPVIEQR